MSKVKFNVNSEYMYISNFKILQSMYPPSKRSEVSQEANSGAQTDCFTRHGIDRTVPVESLIKCKMQDNLEFLQWSKRFWDTNYPGGDYDAIGRRRGSGAPPASGGPRAANTTARRGVAPGGSAPRTRTPQGAGGMGGAASAALRSENEQLKETVVGLERERDFYFSKLRDIELLIQQAIEADPKVDEDETHILKQIQAILYSTEVRFSPTLLLATEHYEPTILTVSKRTALRFQPRRRRIFPRKRLSSAAAVAAEVRCGYAFRDEHGLGR
jgi:RP/EB family microtubule-associated protein